MVQYKAYVNIVNRLGVTHACDRDTDRHYRSKCPAYLRCAANKNGKNVNEFFFIGRMRSGRSFRLRPAKKNGQMGSDRVRPTKKKPTRHTRRKV